MKMFPLLLLLFYPILISSNSIDSLYLNLINQNLTSFSSFNRFYQDFLRDVRQYRVIDTVSSPINLEKIRSNNYNEDYLANSCYETASDLLYAHGYNPNNLQLSPADLQLLLPAILNVVENPGCERQSPPVKGHAFFNGWIFGFLAILFMKTIHLLTFFISGNHSSALTTSGIQRTLSTHAEAVRTTDEDVRSPPVKYHLWLGLGFNAFTCGIILGTIMYHLIPHIYEIPSEDFDYTYILRGTVVLCGVFLFFIVEKLLRFRFKVDETEFRPADDDDEHNRGTQPSDESMIQMAKKHGTFHVQEGEHIHPSYPESPIRLPANADAGDETTNLQSHADHRHPSHRDASEYKHRLILYYVIYDLTNDLIYGCGLATAISHDYFVGFVLWLMVFSEGFRRHSQLLSAIGRKAGFKFLFLSIIFLLVGYVLGGIFIQMSQQYHIQITFLQKEYIYSIVYGALFYTALVILIPELNDFGQHLQDLVKTVDQTSKQRRLLKGLILLCQNLFLIIGVLITLILAILWRYYQRIHIYQYVCKRDPYRVFCPTI